MSHQNLPPLHLGSSESEVREVLQERIPALRWKKAHCFAGVDGQTLVALKSEDLVKAIFPDCDTSTIHRIWEVGQQTRVRLLRDRMSIGVPQNQHLGMTHDDDKHLVDHHGSMQAYEAGHHVNDGTNRHGPKQSKNFKKENLLNEVPDKIEFLQNLSSNGSNVSPMLGYRNTVDVEPVHFRNGKNVSGMNDSATLLDSSEVSGLIAGTKSGNNIKGKEVSKTSSQSIDHLKRKKRPSKSDRLSNSSYQGSQADTESNFGGPTPTAATNSPVKIAWANLVGTGNPNVNSNSNDINQPRNDADIRNANNMFARKDDFPLPGPKRGTFLQKSLDGSGGNGNGDYGNSNGGNTLDPNQTYRHLFPHGKGYHTRNIRNNPYASTLRDFDPTYISQDYDFQDHGRVNHPGEGQYSNTSDRWVYAGGATTGQSNLAHSGGFLDALKTLGAGDYRDNVPSKSDNPRTSGHAWLRATVKNNSMPSDDLVLLPLARNTKTYFCTDCVYSEDDLKLQQVLKRKFRYGLIDLKPETDEQCVLFCLNCSRTLNNKAYLNARFPNNVEKLTQNIHNSDQINDFLLRNHSKKLRERGFTCYQFTGELLGIRGHQESTIGNSELKYSIPMSTSDREHLYAAQSRNSGSYDQNGTNNSLVSTEVGSCNPLRKLHYWTNHAAACPQFHALKSEITGVSDPIHEMLNIKNAEIVGGNSKSESAGPDAPHKVYFLNLHPSIWSMSDAPWFTVEILDHLGHVFARSRLPNVAYMISNTNKNEPGPHVCRLSLTGGPKRCVTCDVYVACEVTDCKGKTGGSGGLTGGLTASIIDSNGDGKVDDDEKKADVPQNNTSGQGLPLDQDQWKMNRTKMVNASRVGLGGGSSNNSYLTEDTQGKITDLVSEAAPQSFASFRNKLVPARNIRLTFIKVEFDQPSFSQSTLGWQARLFLTPDPTHSPDVEYFVYLTGMLPVGDIGGNSNAMGSGSSSGGGIGASSGDFATNVIYNRIKNGNNNNQGGIMSGVSQSGGGGNGINPGCRKYPVTVDVILPRVDYKFSTSGTAESVTDMEKCKRIRFRMFANSDKIRGNLGANNNNLNQLSNNYDPNIATDDTQLALLDPTVSDLADWREQGRYDMIRDGKWIAKLLPIHLGTYQIAIGSGANAMALEDNLPAAGFNSTIGNVKTSAASSHNSLNTSAAAGWDYALDSKILTALTLDPRYMRAYLFCVDVLLEAWGYVLINDRTSWRLINGQDLKNKMKGGNIMADQNMNNNNNNKILNDDDSSDDEDDNELNVFNRFRGVENSPEKLLNQSSEQMYIDKITVKHPSTLERAVIHDQSVHLESEYLESLAKDKKTRSLPGFPPRAHQEMSELGGNGGSRGPKAGPRRLHDTTEGGRFISSSSSGSSSHFSPDGWKLRHLLISLRMFRLDSLYDVVNEIGLDILAKGCVLNLDDSGWEEAVSSAKGDSRMAKKWFLDNIAVLGRSGQPDLWVPTLRELLYCNLNGNRIPNIEERALLNRMGKEV